MMALACTILGIIGVIVLSIFMGKTKRYKLAFISIAIGSTSGRITDSNE